jgi:hypothetical protein
LGVALIDALLSQACAHFNFVPWQAIFVIGPRVCSFVRAASRRLGHRVPMAPFVTRADHRKPSTMENAGLGQLTDYITLNEVARQLGASYHTARSLALAGLLGEHTFLAGAYLYPRATAEAAIRRKLDRQRNDRRDSPAVEGT